MHFIYTFFYIIEEVVTLQLNVNFSLFQVAQVFAYTLGISLSLVTIKPSNNLTSPNATESTIRLTSESCCYVSTLLLHN
jgi:hypothetical protein